MANHDVAAILHHLRGRAERPLVIVITADDIAAWREEGRTDAEIAAAIAWLAPHLDLAARILPGALLRRADAVETMGGAR